MLPPKEQIEQLQKQNANRFQDQPEKEIPQPEYVPESRYEFGPPDFGDEELEEEILDDAPQEAPDFSREDPFLERPSFEVPSNAEAPETVSLKSPGNAFMNDELLFPGGPTTTDLASWKKQFEIEGHSVNLSEIADEIFIWRTFNRVEYREIMSLPNTDPLQREEIICEVCVLYPPNFDFTEMSKGRAGIPAVLAQQIMKKSGFEQPSDPIRL